MELYDGMKVSGKIEGKDVENGVISTKGCHDYYFCQDIKSGDTSGDLKGFKKSWSFHITPSGYSSDVTDLKALERTIEDVQEGDIIDIAGSDTRTVLGVCGQAVMLSYRSEFESYATTLSIKQLKDDGYTIVVPEPPKVTITCEGKDVEIPRESAKALNLV